jgi:hypothetical protein
VETHVTQLSEALNARKYSSAIRYPVTCNPALPHYKTVSEKRFYSHPKSQKFPYLWTYKERHFQEHVRWVYETCTPTVARYALRVTPRSVASNFICI